MGNKQSYPEVDLSGKVAIVTGGNAGIGYATSKALARLGAHTFIACRSKERAEAAIEQMKAELGVVTSTPEAATPEATAEDTPEATDAEGGGAGEDVKSKEGKKVGEIEYLPLDLSSFQSTKDFVRAFKEKHLPLHILVNNAGIAFVAYRKTEDGFESMFQVNYLSHLLMTLELLPLLQDTAAQSGDVRIVNMTSQGYRMAAPFNPEQLNKKDEEGHTRFGQYNSTKLYIVMGGFALQRRLPGDNITISSVDPGFVNTDASRAFQELKVMAFIQKTLARTIGRTPDAGAATVINCAVNPDLNSQRHVEYESCRPKTCTADALNEGFQEELWRRSFEFLKDQLSPEISEKYGPKSEPEAEGDTPQQERETGGQQEGETEETGGSQQERETEGVPQEEKVGGSQHEEESSQDQEKGDNIVVGNDENSRTAEGEKG